ncbi:MAG: HAD-IC family P-type ATPase, partial [Acidimicrobiales bacterium]|nr:HAD-IC family P-type ATPase [Acidimicrobiales bacterium]
EALSAFGGSRRGLGRKEAVRRRSSVGPNTLPPPEHRSIGAELLAQLTNMFAVVLIVAAGLTFLIFFLSSSPDVSNLELAFGILGVVVLNAIVGFVQEHSAERTAEALQAMVPQTARVIRDGALEEVGAEELVPGDLVVLEAGDAVSADCRVIEGHRLSIEMTALTGESEPVARTDQPVAARQLLEARNCVFTGTSVVAGTGRAVVFATGLHTEFGWIYRLTAALPAEQSPLQRQVTSMARRVAAVAIAVGSLLFALRVLTVSAVSLSFVFALGVMVALVPEGLPATLSVSLAIGVRRMARRHALIKRLTAVEALGSTTVICTDKTGTLTTAEMTLEQIYVSGRLHAVGGVGYAPEGQVEDPGPALDLLRVAALCSDARLVAPSGQARWRVLGDTTEGAILVAAAKAGLCLSAEEARTPRVGVFPFDPDRKLMSTVHRGLSEYEAYVKGSPQAVLERCTDAVWEGRPRPLDQQLRGQIGEANDAMAKRAMRVLAVARRPLSSERMTPRCRPVAGPGSRSSW